MNKGVSVALGGAIGSVLRYYVAGWFQNRLGASFPYGTLIVNVSGAFLIGLLMTAFLEHFDASPQWRLFLVIGVLGGYTTFSSLTWEAYQLIRSGSVIASILYAGGSFAAGFTGLLAGVWIARWI